MLDVLKKRYQSFGTTGLLNNGTDNYSIVQPIQFNMLGGIYFNPAYDVRMVFRSTNTDVLILNGFSTALGNYGFLPLDIPGRAEDTYQVNVVNMQGATINFVFSVMFYFDPTQPMSQS